MSNETGHAKNIDSANRTVTVITSFGTDYNPSKPSIKLTAFKAQVVATETDQEAFLTAQRTNLNDKNIRKTEFKVLPTLATRLLGAIKATDANEPTVEDAEGFVRKLRGGRADNSSTPAPAPGDGEDHEHSVSQRSFYNLIEHLKGLHGIISTEPTYAPNETELKPATIATLIARLTTLNKAEDTSFTKMNKARTARNNRLYSPNTGILATVEDIKNYVTSLYGARSPQMKQLTVIKFKAM